VLSSRAVVGAVRRTKIVATLGPATDDEAIFKKLITAGVDVVRLNYSHQTREQHAARVQTLRELTRQIGAEVGVIADLRGPKIRLERFKNESVYLQDGDEFTLDVELDPVKGTNPTSALTTKTFRKTLNEAIPCFSTMAESYSRLSVSSLVAWSVWFC